MGVYIKGMEMPESCYECRFFVDTWCYAFKADDWRNAYNKPAKGKRLNNCPLVPVPPHGRLIDADALIATENQHYALIEDDWYVTVRKVECMPTIIPAEEGE